MNRALRNTLAGATLVGALSACTANFESGDQALIENAFAKTAQFWGNQGVNLAKSTRPLLLQGEQKYTCNKEKWTSTTSAIGYCAAENTIIIPAAAAKEVLSTNTPQGGMSGVLGHEFGHVVQSVKSEALKSAPADSQQKEVFKEVQATCFAGVMIAKTDPSLGPGARREFQRTEDSDTHGSRAAQLAAFDQGLNAGANRQDPFKACAVVAIS